MCEVKCPHLAKSLRHHNMEMGDATYGGDCNSLALFPFSNKATDATLVFIMPSTLIAFPRSPLQ